MVEEPTIIRSKELFLPLKDDSFPNNQTYSEGPVPSLVSDMAVAEQTKDTS